MTADLGQEHTLIEIDGGSTGWSVTFSTNGEYLVSGGIENVGVWRVGDGKQIATMEAKGVQCLAISKDDIWIAAGTVWGWVIVWDTKTYKKVFMHKDDDQLRGVDFSPNQSHIVTASNTATVWDVATRKQVLVLTLCHEGLVRAVKYSPQGDRIAAATQKSIRVYDSNDGRLLVDIPVGVAPWYNTGLLWPNNYLFVVSDSKVKKIEASTGTAVSEWPIPGTNGSNYACIALSKHGEFITFSANSTIVFWDAPMHTQLARIQHPRNIRSIILSPDDQFLTIGAEDGKLTIKNIRDIILAPSYSIVSIVWCWMIACQNGFIVNLPYFDLRCEN